MNRNRHFAAAIQKLKDEKRYRVFANLERSAAALPARNCGGPDEAGPNLPAT